MNPERPSASPASEYRRIVVCADDFGMNATVDAGVLGLAGLGRLSATSLLVDGPSAAHNLPALLATHLQVGLHLNLTESFGQRGFCQPLKSLIQSAYLRRLPLDQVRTEISRQLDGFQNLTGRLPDYVDGHQHVHQLPGVRDLLLQALKDRAATPWIRDTGRPRLAGLPWRLRVKARVIAGLGAAGLRRRVQAAGLIQNPGFLGVYDFTGGVSAYETWMSRWLAQARDGDVLMCHPAQGTDARDALSDQRQAEYAVLSSARMAQRLADHHLTIAGTDPCKEPS
ncbi:MAG: ChbG/HpnK family deacetylase [Castellaniella sp.]|uniref:ChbG/HpnK family deacetylase n=1 Tax=Castellaniella sp. TaxID=1955812 RepID=UPI003C71A1C4